MYFMNGETSSISRVIYCVSMHDCVAWYLEGRSGIICYILLFVQIHRSGIIFCIFVIVFVICTNTFYNVAATMERGNLGVGKALCLGYKHNQWLPITPALPEYVHTSGTNINTQTQNIQHTSSARISWYYSCIWKRKYIFFSFFVKKQTNIYSYFHLLQSVSRFYGFEAIFQDYSHMK